MKQTFFAVLTLSSFLLSLPVVASGGAPKVGRAAAAKYFQKNPQAVTENVRYPSSESESSYSGDRYLSLGFSHYTKSESFSWGSVNKENNVGKWGIDMNYFIGQYNSLLDYSLRVNYTEFEPDNQRASKMSFLFGVSLPDASSRFPLYFGAALGAGVYFNQLSGESPLTLDYQLFTGLRLFEIMNQTGFFIEGGLKNHLQLTSDGQLNGTYISAGAIFTF